MKKIMMIVLAAALVTFGFVGRADAVSFYNYEDFNGVVVNTDTYSGTYMFTVTDPQNDNANSIYEIEGAVGDWFALNAPSYDFTGFEFYAKVDEPKTSTTGMTVTYYSGNLSGAWATDLPVEFYTVKGAKEFALYWLGEGGQDSGLWTTAHLTNPGGNPEISHLSTWNPGTPVSEVPEPSTVLLLGAGLLGLVGLGRKRLQK